MINSVSLHRGTSRNLFRTIVLLALHSMKVMCPYMHTTTIIIIVVVVVIIKSYSGKTNTLFKLHRMKS